MSKTRDQMNKALSELALARADIERLREALRNLISSVIDHDVGGFNESMYESVEQAGEALTATERGV